MDRVVGSALGHVAADAVRSRFVRARGGSLNSRLVAVETNLVVVGRCLLPTGNVVRIVATGTEQLSLALSKAFRFAEPVPSLGNLKVSEVSLRAVERHLVVAQRLTRHIGERDPIDPHNFRQGSPYYNIH